MCDDMGYGDLVYYGQKLISTPNLDSMVKIIRQEHTPSEHFKVTLPNEQERR